MLCISSCLKMRNESIRSCASRVRLVDEPWNGLAPSYAFLMSLTGEEYSFEGLNVWNNLPLPFLRAQTEAEGCPRSVQQSQREKKMWGHSLLERRHAGY